MASQNEKVFFGSGDVFVSNARIVAGSQTYAMSSITSVKASVESPSLKGPLILGAITAVMLMSAFNARAGSGASLVVAIVLFAATIYWFCSMKATYTIVLRFASNETDTFKTHDRSIAEDVVRALNSAIVHRG